MAKARKKLFEVAIIKHEEVYFDYGRIEIESRLLVDKRYLAQDEETAKRQALRDIPVDAAFKDEELEILVRPF